MTIETKFSVGDTVYLIHDNRITSGTIYKITIDITGIEDTYIYYHLEVNRYDVKRVIEERLFASKEQLIQSL